ncbi:Hypothetical_protein [Hexamita inflata]|uniref:Hypothetical_protein n=1 Tax=Hexamita inflata TaxID=28002 RepID=A0AA86RAG2_9EUKA|nr:Hypothetical protein HINF_LOCUS56619 [Hexamita inflata]
MITAKYLTIPINYEQLCNMNPSNYDQPFELKSIVQQRPSFFRQESKLLCEYIPTYQDLSSLNSVLPPTGFNFQKIRIISYLEPAVEFRIWKFVFHLEIQISIYFY